MLALITIIGIPLGILGEIGKNKIKKQAILLQQQKYQEEQDFRKKVLENMNSK